MKKMVIILMVLALTALIVAGCASKSEPGYASYGGGNSPPQGGGGCGRYSGTQANPDSNVGNQIVQIGL